MKNKIAFVVQRYGLEVNGGAEYIARLFAEHLSDHYDIEILTSCAIDHYTWKNEYKPGLEKIYGIDVRRFPVEKERQMEKFAVLCNRVLNTQTNKKEQVRWLEEQGPYMPALVDFIVDHEAEFDRFVFFTYLYYQSYFGLLKVPQKAILLPAAHDEPSLYLNIYKEVFQRVGKLAFLTPEERDLVLRTFEISKKPHEVVGVGIDTSAIQPEAIKQLDGLDYVIYVGRIEEGKGCKEMFDFFSLYKDRHPGDLKLALIGKANMQIPNRDDVLHLGFVSEGEKKFAVQHARFLIMPSQYESLSLVLLEAFEQGVPALVNGKCEVLKGHCMRSNAGLWYEDYFEFEEAITFMNGADSTEALGENAKKYIKSDYLWQNCILSWQKLLR